MPTAHHTRIRFLAILLGFLLFPLLACSVDWPPRRGPARGERPVATSTPAATIAASSPTVSSPTVSLPTVPLPTASPTIVSIMIVPPTIASSTILSPTGERPPAGLRKVPPPTVVAPVAALPGIEVDLSARSTAEQLDIVVAPVRDLRDLALRLEPEHDEIPVVVNAETPNYEIGDQLDFWVHDLESNSNFQITAELIHKTAVAYAWVEIGRSYDRESLMRSIDRFSEASYAAEVAFFGSEWQPGVDNDPRLHILHANGMGGSIAGYYSSADEYSRLARDFSNEKEMFYVNLSWLNSSSNYDYYETVLAHEFQHMIHWNADRNEETWVNEGLSEFAQEIAGYGPDTIFARSFANVPDTQLNTWSDDQGNNGAHYGSAYLFMEYFAQRFGQDMMQALVAHPANGIRGFNDILVAADRQDIAELDFDDVFADWVVANYVDDPNALAQPGVYGYQDFVQIAPVLEESYSTYPTDLQRTTVYNYATDYVLLEGSGAVTLYFEGETATRLADLDAYSGQYAWWSHRGDDFDTRLTRMFDLRAVAPGTPVEMDVAMWWDIEDDYDFGYVLVSQDGETWAFLEGQHTQTTAGTADGSDNSFGPGYSAQSGENGNGATWVVEKFDLSPYVGEQIWLRFEYVTDDAVNNRGWFIDDIHIPALDYAADFEQDDGGWESEGWLLTDNRLAQPWLLQVMSFEDNLLTSVERYSVDDKGQAQIEIDDLGNGKTAVLAISGLAPVTTEPAAYEYRIEPR